MRLSQISQALAALATLAAASPTKKQQSFGYSGSEFLLNGEAYQIVGGQMDPQRVPYQLWDDRMEMARAMGLNTIFSYLYWDQIEPVQGKWSTDGNNNIEGWVKSAQAHGLHVVLRPGPYICGEHEWGGFPSWLSTINNMTVRSNNPQFLAATKTYLDYLGNWLQPYFAGKGGPILMAQVENEYGFYADDHAYTQALADILGDAFPTVTLYTNDGSSQGALGAGSIPGILAETDGPISGFVGRDSWIAPSSVGPYLDGEYYITWIDQWGANNTHSSDIGNTAQIQSIQSDFDAVLSNGSSFSIYMFHGGTNWGFQNGADFGSAYEPVTTSYDYGAPLDESGRPNSVYMAVRSTISKYVKDIPDVPSKPAVSTTSPITLQPAMSLFSDLPSSPTFAQSPANMEELGQATGFILYRYNSTGAVSGALKLGDGARDRALIYVNEQRVGIIDATYQNPQVVNLNLKSGDQLDILIENLGRINFGNLIPDQRKGIVGDVYVGSTLIQGFNQYNLPSDSPPNISTNTALTSSVSPSSPPTWYGANFDMETPGDTFLSLPGWTKGVVYVNGINLGRYWTIGPQQELYLPGAYLKSSGNAVWVLNLEPTGIEGPIQGVATRTWGNNPDPDAPPS